MASPPNSEILPTLRHTLMASLLLVALVANGTPAAAKRFAVDSPVDASDAAPGDGLCRSAAGSCTLRAAVEEANAHPDADVVALPAGTYLLSSDPAAGKLVVVHDLDIAGDGAESTILDGGEQTSLLRVEGAIRVRFNDLAMRGGRPENSRVIENRGTLVLAGCRLYDNGDGTSQSSVIESHGDLTLIDSVLEGNRGTLIYASRALTLERTALRDNEGTIECEGGNTPRILRSEISHNGGGVYGCPVVVDSTIRDNDAYGIACPGSGVVLLRSVVSGNGVAGVNSDGSAYVIDSVVRDNGATPPRALSGLGVVGNGGIVALGKVFARRSEFSDNHGYGIDVETTADLDNVTVSGNDSGGLQLGASGSRLRHVTIVDNTGAGINFYDYGAAVMSHSILAGNADANGAPANCRGAAGALALDGYNIMSDDDCGATATATDRIGVDPQLGPLQENGGPTRTHAPLPGSPAIDGGAATCLAVDQRGARRPQAERCDIGAVEVQTTCGDGVVDSGEDCDDGNTADGDCCTSQCRFTNLPVGDCAGDGRVTITDLLQAVALALHDEYPFDCPAADRNGDLHIEVAELVAAARNALDGFAASCPAPDRPSGPAGKRPD